MLADQELGCFKLQVERKLMSHIPTSIIIPIYISLVRNSRSWYFIDIIRDIRRLQHQTAMGLVALLM